MNAPRVPEILVIGTMKGGTTAIWTYLRKHPNVMAGVTKEIHYFTMHSNESVDWYKNQFPVREPGVFSLDASPTYFDMADDHILPQKIKAIVPNAALILCVRDPIERAISHYHHIIKAPGANAVFDGMDINTFFRRGLAGDNGPGGAHLNHIIYALTFSMYDKKYERYCDVFGKKRILVLENDDIVSRPDTVMARVLPHCGLASIPRVHQEPEYNLDRREHELDPELRQRLAERLYPSYERFRKLAGLPERNG